MFEDSGRWKRYWKYDDVPSMPWTGHNLFLPHPALPSLGLNPYSQIYILRVVLHDWPDARRI
jgi:hypothetical protein